MDNLAQTHNYSNPQPRYMDFKVHAKPNNIKAKKLQKSRTLMRQALYSKSNPKTNSINDSNNTSSKINNSARSFRSYRSLDLTETPRIPLKSYDPDRFNRVQNIPRSELINRFKSTSQPQDPVNSQSFTSNYPKTESLDNETFYNDQRIVSKPLQETTISEPLNNTANNSRTIFENAIYSTPNNSDVEWHSKKKQKIKKHIIRQHPALSAVGLLIGILLVGGIYFFHNLNQVSYYLASSRAGFTPAVASYIPSGFNLASISSANGVIETKYSSNSSNHNYSLVEKKSNISSSNLVNNYVFNLVGANYQELNVHGKSVYIFNGNSEATWVRNGIWYIIKNDNSLSNHQIYQIVSSM